MPYLKNLVILAILLLMTGCVSAGGPNRSPAPIADSKSGDNADPAVIFANANRTGDIAYGEGYFGSGENRLHYVEAGKGPIIIFYHGFPSFWYSWFDQMEALKGSYRVVAVDALGSGLSAKPHNLAPYKIANLAAQLDAFSRHIGGDEKYILVGHDWGSVLALSYAQAYPKRLHKVIGMSAPPANLFLSFVAKNKEQQRRNQYMQDIRNTSLQQLRATKAAQRIGPDSYKRLLDRGDISQDEAILFHNALASDDTIFAAMNWYRANVPAFDTITDTDLWPGRDAKISVPALFIWGEADQIFVPELIDQMKDYATDLRIVRLPGINHWTSMEQSERATQTIVSFVGEQP